MKLIWTLVCVLMLSGPVLSAETPAQRAVVKVLEASGVFGNLAYSYYYPERGKFALVSGLTSAVLFFCDAPDAVIFASIAITYLSSIGRVKTP